MKVCTTMSLLYAVIFFITSTGCKKTPVVVTPPLVVDTRPYKLVWGDEFDYTGLPTPTKWGYETGLVRNNEKQYFTDARIENVYVGNGVLTIEGKKENYYSLADYTSASLSSEGKASWKYGKIEIKAKMPKAVGTWPALWLLGTDYPAKGWPMCGEIDIMEAVGKDLNKVFGTVHYGSSWPNNYHKKGGIVNSTAMYDNFHVYSIEWSPEDIKFFLDDNNYFTFKKSDVMAGQQWAFDKTYYLILNLAIGGNWGGGDSRFPPFGIDDNLFPQKLLIDYVRVYQRG